MTAFTLPSFLAAARSGPWAIYLEQIERVRPWLGALGELAETLVRPKRILIVDVPIRMDDGTMAHFEGYRVQHNTARGPGKGGVRFHPGVTVSYFEWVQDFSSFYWSEQEINARLDRVMTEAYAAIAEVASRRGTSLRTAAYIVACERILQARQLRGLYP